MNRAELIGQIAEMTGQTKTEIGGTITAIIHSITGAMAKGDKVTLVGFGTFERRMRQARTGRNPRTLAPLKIASAKVPAFRAGSELKEVIDGKTKQRSFAKVGTTAAKKAVAKKAVVKKTVAKKAAKSKKTLIKQSILVRRGASGLPFSLSREQSQTNLRLNLSQCISEKPNMVAEEK